MRWERGEVAKLPDIDIGEITPLEECILARRRRGWSVRKIAHFMRVGVSTFSAMENGHIDPARLVQFWSNRPKKWTKK